MWRKLLLELLAQLVIEYGPEIIDAIGKLIIEIIESLSSPEEKVAFVADLHQVVTAKTTDGGGKGNKETLTT